ncbi:MAG: molecular chaperone HtpG [Desulfovibrionaceae bacterium]|nr:molecular chaperone HtpG [Desulfovibrionaceae bacterium]
MADEANKHEFRAEVRKVLNILTNSLYTNREIFLRELISNASDALDKLRFRSNRGETPIHNDLPLDIHIKVDKDKKILTISDTGVGMTDTELAENLGTIAHSGSENFLADFANEHQAEEAKDASNIIGRFGVGFYSVFMVADEVRVTSRPAFGEQATAYVWVSDGLGTYTLETTTAEEPKRGTSIEVHLKSTAEEFAHPFKIREIIQKHSAFIPFPIYVDDEQANTQPALWREPKSSVTQEQYQNFYKAMTFDSEDALSVQHIAVDVPVQFAALLFIPSRKQDIYGLDQDNWGLDLYSRRVLIQRKNRDVVPDFLGFMKGVVDVEDLPLNISRETLQENVLLQKIKQVIIKQTLGVLEKMCKDEPQNYEKFWEEHGRIFKLGYHDMTNHERISALFRFNSSSLPDGENGKILWTSLDEYMGRAKPGQKTFWFVQAQNREAARLNPHVEMFKKKGLEVFYFLDPIDEFALGQGGTYKDWNFKSVDTAEPDDLKDFPDVETEKTEDAATPLSDEDNAIFDAFVKYIKRELGDKVKEVRVSERLADSPAVFVSDKGISSNMEKFMKVMQKDDSVPVRDMEVNRDHALLRHMFSIFKADKEDSTLKEMVDSLYDYCLLLDGYVREPYLLADRIQNLLTKASTWYKTVRNLA